MADVQASASAQAAAPTPKAAAGDTPADACAQQQASSAQQEPASSTAAAAPPPPAAAAAAAAEAGDKDVPQVTFKVQYGKQSQELKRPATSTIAELKADVEKALSIPPAMQKLMFKGLLKNDTDTLGKVGIRNGSKVLLIGSSQADIAATSKPGPAAAAGGDGAKLAWDAPKADEDPSKQPQHAKIIAKGVPEDAMPGISGHQVPLPDELVNFQYMYNNTGSKVRLTFKTELQQLWIASATNTQKIPYSSMTKIDAWPLPALEGYSMVSLHLGVGGTSRYWLYFFPSQYTSGIKIRLLGVQSLL